MILCGKKRMCSVLLKGTLNMEGTHLASITVLQRNLPNVNTKHGLLPSVLLELTKIFKSYSERNIFL